VRCAIAIQEDLAVRNAQMLENNQMWFRIGINIGDVMVEGDDLFGDGVNVAARLETLADQGGICISGSTFEQVKNKLSVAFDDIGAQKVKNIPEPVPAFCIVPGEVKVAKGRQSDVRPSGHFLSGLRPTLLVAVAAGAIAVLAAVYFAGGIPSSGSVYLFDGRWKVTVSAKSGCRDNSSASYSMTVKQGLVEETQHRKPKIGSISNDGEFAIEVTDSSGELRNTQSGKITGDFGKGRFQGRKPTCIGDVTLERLHN
jgi:hypothetical protein